MIRIALLTLSLATLLAADLEAQRQGRRRGRGRFPQPTAEELTKPTLVQWQRNLDDALKVAEATGKPLFIAVNMDGEMASESFAGIIYRRPEFAKLTEGFVPVIASPDRHNPTDYDENGNRIPCPRFGCVTCGEHIAIEPKLYQRFFGGERSAPRHLGFSLAGGDKELFDLQLLNDLSRVDDQLVAHRPEATVPAESARTKDRNALLASPAASDRSALEAMMAAADSSGRRELLREAASAPITHHELIRIGLSDSDETVQSAALELLAQTATVDAVGLFDAAFDCAERLGGHRDLLAALKPWAADNDEARRIYRIRSGLYGKSKAVDIDAWRAVLADNPGEGYPAADRSELEQLDRRMERLGRARKRHPGDDRVLVEMALANMRYAQVRLAFGNDPQFLLQDVQATAEQAIALEGPDEGRARGLAAWSAYMLGDFEAAAAQAEQALPMLVNHAEDPLVAEVLALFADCRVRSIYGAWAGYGFESSWVADAHSAFRALALHGGAKEESYSKQIDWLETMKAFDQEGEALEVSLARMSWSAEVQERLRRRLLREQGPSGLIEGFAALEVPSGQEATMSWFAGYNALVAAEQYLGESRAVTPARQAYEKSVELLTESAIQEASFTDSANHFAALALAGQAKLAMDAGDYDAAVQQLCEALSRRPGTAPLKDGLGNTPLATARLLLNKLKGSEKAALRKQLQSCLREHDIALD